MAWTWYGSKLNEISVTQVPICLLYNQLVDSETSKSAALQCSGMVLAHLAGKASK
jgi:hypothetical protein